jgi:cytochrome c peroxidase
MNLCGVLLNGGGTVFNVPGPTNGFNITQFLGLFKVPTTRNVDLRPNKDDFVKAYMHNGVFTSLEEVVHFYNKRNIAVNAQGQEFVFDLRFPQTIPPGYTRLFPPPEVLDNVQNVEGRTPANAGPDVANNGQVGNLQLTPQEEADVVAFLKILSDFFTAPNPVPNPVLNPCGTP